MFNNKKSLVKLTAGFSLCVVMVLGGNTANNLFQNQTVQAASSYKVKLKRNAYIYNYKGNLMPKNALKKGKILKVYRSKKIKSKKYLYIGKHQYIKAVNATKNSSKNVLFSVIVNPGTDLYVAPNGELSNWTMQDKQNVYEVSTDANGLTWYKIAKNNWVKSTDTNKPKSISNQLSSNTTKKTETNNDNASKQSNAAKKSKKKNSSKTKNIQTRATSQFASEIESSFIDQLNATRQRMGKRSLTLDSSLNSFAHTRSNELIDKFSHERPNGQSFTYSECISMDMIDANTTASEAAKKVLDRFLYDDAASNWGHRDALWDSSYHKIGVGVTWETKPGTSWNNYRFPEYMGFRMAVEMK